MTDAAQRAEELRMIVHGSTDAIPGVCGTVGVLMEPCAQCKRVDAAVAEAVKGRDEEIARLRADRDNLGDRLTPPSRWKE